MATIKGITVHLHEKTEAGVDEFNRAQFTERLVPVDNVLVAPVVIGIDEYSRTNVNSKRARCELAIPKGDTHNWEDCKVDFWGDTWESVGYSTIGMEHQIPLDWNRKVVVQRVG